jgi:hypothetical protein
LPLDPVQENSPRNVQNPNEQSSSNDESKDLSSSREILQDDSKIILEGYSEIAENRSQYANQKSGLSLALDLNALANPIKKEPIDLGFPTFRNQTNQLRSGQCSRVKLVPKNYQSRSSLVQSHSQSQNNLSDHNFSRKFDGGDRNSGLNIFQIVQADDKSKIHPQTINQKNKSATDIREVSHQENDKKIRSSIKRFQVEQAEAIFANVGQS